MLMMDPGKAILTIIKKRKDSKSADMAADAGKPLKEMDGELDPRHMAAEEIMSAIHSKSPQDLAKALGNFHDLHMAHKDMADQSMESDSPDL